MLLRFLMKAPICVLCQPTSYLLIGHYSICLNSLVAGKTKAARAGDISVQESWRHLRPIICSDSRSYETFAKGFEAL